MVTTMTTIDAEGHPHLTVVRKDGRHEDLVWDDQTQTWRKP
jgi:hypothetical protein